MVSWTVVARAVLSAALIGIAAALSVDDGAVALVAPKGAHGAGSGPVIRMVALGQVPTDLAVDPRSGRAFIAAAAVSPQRAGIHGPGTVAVFATASGVLLHRVAVGDYPCALLAVPRAGRVLVTVGNRSGSDTVSTLDSTDGRILRTVAVGVGPCTVALRLVSRGPCNGHMPCLVALGGCAVRDVGPCIGAQAVDECTGRAFFANARLGFVPFPQLGAGSVRTLDAQTGAPLRTTAIRGDPGAVAVDEQTGRVFVGAIDATSARAYVGMLDAASGHLLRTVAVAGPADFGLKLLVDSRDQRVFVIAADHGPVSLLDAATGALLRTIGSRGVAAWALDARAARVFLAGSDGTMTLLDAKSGAVVGAVPIGRDVTSVVADERTGRVFVTRLAPSGGASLSVLDANRGRVLRTRPMDVGVRLAAVDQREGRVIAAGHGVVSVLDGYNGATLRTLVVPGKAAVIATAVDERTGHAVIVTADGRVGMLDVSR